MIREFTVFLKQYGVIGLAVAVIIGGKLMAASIDFLVVALIVFWMARKILREETVTGK